MNKGELLSAPGGDRKPGPRNRASEFLAGALRILAVLSALTLFALFAGAVLMLGVGRWLVRQDTLQKANAVAVLSGNFPARAFEAANLYHDGYAKEIWLTNPGPDPLALKALGIRYPSEADFNLLLLRREGVPAKAIHILDGLVVNTVDELDVISSTMQKQKDAVVILVTDKPHTRRVHELWARYEVSRGKAVVHAVTDDDFDPDAWWKSTEDTRQVIHEVMGMVNVWAGMPMRTRFREQQSSVAEMNSRRSAPIPEAEAPSAEPVQQE